MKNKLILIPVILTIVAGACGWLIGRTNIKPIRRDIVVQARQYAYNPARMEVNKGDTLHIKLVSLDVIHGFYLEGYDIDAEIPSNLKTFKVRKPSEGDIWKDATEIVLVVNKTGKFRYRCSHTCGTMHPFMQGELIVNPNSVFHAGLGGIFGLVAGMLIMFYMRNKKQTIAGDE
jgi:heme/copper-type cytochrome/quinol oxidase subunit 2